MPVRFTHMQYYDLNDIIQPSDQEQFKINFNNDYCSYFSIKSLIPQYKLEENSTIS